MLGVSREQIRVLVRKSEEKRQLGRPSHNRKITLEWILGKQGERVWTRFRLRIGISGAVMNLRVP
jgi:hypothetical protein